MIWMVVFWVAVCVGVMWFARPGWCSGASSWWGSRDSSAHEEQALQTLDRRFAEGAVSFDEYRARKAILRGERLDAASLGSDRSTSEGAGT